MDLKILAGSALASMLLCVQPTKAEIQHNRPIYWSNQDWAVFSYPSESMCELSTKGPKGEMFTYGVYPKLGMRIFIFAISGIKPAEYPKTYKIDVVLLPKKDDFNSLYFSVNRENGEYTSFYSPNMPASFEDSLVNNDVLAIADFTKPTPEKQLIALISLRGSREGLTKLRECLSKVE